MQRTINRYLASISSPSPNKLLLPLAVVLIMTGCRNTTNAPISPLGGTSALSPLAPVQGAATLSPIQPTSGISTLGAPTRVPPPPTGSYTPPGAYGSTSSFNAPASNYAPTGLTPTGATIGSNGLTRGVTDLNPSFAPAPGRQIDSGVRQTGWVGDASVGASTFGAGVDPRLSPVANAVPSTDPAMRPRSGGMQVIDLTRAPFPPGYVPPQNRPGVGTIPQSVPFPPANSSPGTNRTPNNNAPLGQPTNSTFVRSATGNSGIASFDDRSVPRTASRPNSVLLPSTEPFPAQGSADEQLQWRRPSPKF